MRRLFTSVLLLTLPIAAATAQTPADSAARNLSLEEQTKIADVITRDAGPPIAAGHVSLVIGNAIPPDVALRPVPATVEQMAPQLKGASYVVVEEQIALVDSKTRKIVAVVQRGRRQSGSGPAPTR